MQTICTRLVSLSQTQVFSSSFFFLADLARFASLAQYNEGQTGKSSRSKSRSNCLVSSCQTTVVSPSHLLYRIPKRSACDDKL